MSEEKLPPEGPVADYRVNFFRPRPGFMRKEVACIWVMLAGWALLTFGFQAYLVLTQKNPAGEGALTERVLFGFPFHFWFTGQFLIVWFIFLALIFNVFIDRLTEKHRKRK